MSEYTENIAFNGTLRVKKGYWEIQYYFPGPDLRYNGEFKRIPGTSIEYYVDAFQKAWAEYQVIRATIPAGGEFTKDTSGGLTIRIGGRMPGVCFHPYRMVIGSEEALDALLESFRSAKAKAEQIQMTLFT